MKKLLIVILILFAFQNLKAQDPQFTQFYAAPMYHNPAFTGSGYAPRVMFNYRNQWPSLNANFITSMFSFDYFFESAQSGVGIMALNDNQGYHLVNNEVRLLYSYELKLNPNHGLRLGLNGGYSYRGINPSGLIFGDQLGTNGEIENPTFDPLGKSGVLQDINSLDVGSGILYFNPVFYFGASVNHLTEPKMSYNPDVVPGLESKLPMLIMVNGGYNLDLSHLVDHSREEREFVITPTFLYKQQGQFAQLDLGAYVTYSPLTIGLQYRGIPVSKVVTKFPNQDAISGMIGFRYDNFSFGYSYDLTISGLGAVSGGSHEISVAYQFPTYESDRPIKDKYRKKALRCPKF